MFKNIGAKPAFQTGDFSATFSIVFKELASNWELDGYFNLGRVFPPVYFTIVFTFTARYSGQVFQLTLIYNSL